MRLRPLLIAAFVLVSAAVHPVVCAGDPGLHVQTFGSGPPILFLHGGLQNFDGAWARQRDAFAGSHTVVGIDQRGHGHSPDDERPFSYPGMAEDTAAVLRRLALGPVDVVGHSDGGNVALILASRHPELVRRVGPGHWPIHLAKSYALWLTPVVIDRAALQAIRAPVLVMAGDKDFSSIEDTTEIYRALPNGRLFIVPGSGHGTFSDRPALVDLALREFLER